MNQIVSGPENNSETFAIPISQTPAQITKHLQSISGGEIGDDALKINTLRAVFHNWGSNFDDRNANHFATIVLEILKRDRDEILRNEIKKLWQAFIDTETGYVGIVDNTVNSIEVILTKDGFAKPGNRITQYPVRGVRK